MQLPITDMCFVKWLSAVFTFHCKREFMSIISDEIDWIFSFHEINASEVNLDDKRNTLLQFHGSIFFTIITRKVTNALHK